MPFYPRSFNAWWGAVECAVSEFRVPLTCADVEELKKNFESDWLEMYPSPRLERGYEMTDWANRNYDVIEERILDYLIWKGY